MESGPLQKTQLSVHAEISYDKFVPYLEWMIGRKLIVDTNGLISVTNDGVETYNRLVEWILKYVGKLKFARRR